MTEPFPPLSATVSRNSNYASDSISVRRRKSSGLGGDIRGDVDVPSFATARKGTPPLNSPVNFDVSVWTLTAPPPTSATSANNKDRRQRGQDVVLNVAQSAVPFLNSGASAYGTHGSVH